MAVAAWSCVQPVSLTSRPAFASETPPATTTAMRRLPQAFWRAQSVLRPPRAVAAPPDDRTRAQPRRSNALATRSTARRSFALLRTSSDARWKHITASLPAASISVAVAASSILPSAPRQPSANPRQPTLLNSRTSLTMSRSSSSVYTKSPLRMRTKATTSAASSSAARTSAGEGVRPPQCSDARAQISTRKAPPLTALRTLSRLSQHASKTIAGAGGLSVGSSTSHAGWFSSAIRPSQSSDAAAAPRTGTACLRPPRPHSSNRFGQGSSGDHQR
mmetsp:Transcript_1255/g.3741  ORF Transcript_1255/g.3741 Transcript_1255/m.3741 type:complete len:275 (+) Transcript_1255:215-1039(+)